MKAGVALLLCVPAALPGQTASVPCIDLSNVTGPEITRDGIILYHQGRSRSWRAETRGRCPGLARDSRLATFPFQGRRLRRGDRFQLIEPKSSVSGATCRFDGFVALDRTGGR